MVRLEDKIKQLCRVNNVTQKQLYSAIGVTDAGMRKMYARNSCDVTLLEKIAGYFGISVSTFFEDGNGDMVTAANNSLAINGNGNNANNDTSAFLSLLTKKDEQIDRLLSIIEQMNKSVCSDS